MRLPSGRFSLIVATLCLVSGALISLPGCGQKGQLKLPNASQHTLPPPDISPAAVPSVLPVPVTPPTQKK